MDRNRTAWVVVAFVLLVGGASAENSGNEMAWKTTNDEVRPQDLKEALRDHERHLQRYNVAVAEGRVPEVDLTRRKIVKFVDPAANPELVQMWKALYFLSATIGAVDAPEYREVVVEKLIGDGVSRDGAELVLVACDEYKLRLAREDARDRHLDRLFAGIYEAMLQERPAQDVDELFERATKQAKKGNLKAVAALLQISDDEAREFARINSVELGKLVGVPLLTKLASELTLSDWEALRSYLHDWVRDYVGIMMETELR